MTVKQFIQIYEISGFEIIQDNVIINIMVEGTPHGIDVDTSKIEGGTPLQFIEEYTIADNILEVNGISLNIEETNMLGSSDILS